MILLHCFLLLKSVEPTDVVYSSFSLRFIHYNFRCERAFTFAINITYCIKNKQSSPTHLKSNAKVTSSDKVLLFCSHRYAGLVFSSYRWLPGHSMLWYSISFNRLTSTASCLRWQRTRFVSNASDVTGSRTCKQRLQVILYFSLFFYCLHHLLLL